MLGVCIGMWAQLYRKMPRRAQQALSHLVLYNLHAGVTEPDGLGSAHDQLPSFYRRKVAVGVPEIVPTGCRLFRGFLDVVNAPSHHISCHADSLPKCPASECNKPSKWNSPTPDVVYKTGPLGATAQANEIYCN